MTKHTTNYLLLKLWFDIRQTLLEETLSKLSGFRIKFALELLHSRSETEGFSNLKPLRKMTSHPLASSQLFRHESMS